MNDLTKNDLPNEAFKGRICLLGSVNEEAIQGIYYNRELFVNLNDFSLALHDGITAGGHPIAKADMSNVDAQALLDKLNNLPASKVNFMSFDSFWVSDKGADTFKGTNPQLPKASITTAISNGATHIICNDESTLNLPALSAVTVYAPFARLAATNTSSVIIDENSEMTARSLTNNNDNNIRITINGVLKLSGGIEGTNWITGSGTIYIGSGDTAFLSDDFTGTIIKTDSTKDFFEPFDALRNDSKFVECDAATVKIEDAHKYLVSQMKLYLSTNGEKGVYTKTKEQTCDGLQVGDYFIYDDGSDEFIMPYMLSSRRNSLESYDNVLSSGNTQYQTITYNEDCFVHVNAGNDSGWGYATVRDPSGTQVATFPIASHKSSKAGGGAGAFLLPKNYSVYFGYPYLDVRVVSRQNKEGFNNFKKIRIT